MVLAGVGSIAAASVLLAGIVVLGGDDGTEPDLATRIIAATEDAVATSIEHEVTDFPGGAQPDIEAWRDQATVNARILHHAPDGRGPSLNVGPDTPPDADDGNPSGESELERRVDYCFEEYTIEEHPVPPNSEDHTASVAQQVIDGLNDGSLRTDGTEVVDGKELIRVVQDGDMMSSVWYVDPETYRPVRYVVPPGEHTGEGYVTTIEYLARTAELLAQFTPTIPDGFTEVDELTRTDQHMPGCI